MDNWDEIYDFFSKGNSNSNKDENNDTKKYSNKSKKKNEKEKEKEKERKKEKEKESKKNKHKKSTEKYSIKQDKEKVLEVVDVEEYIGDSIEENRPEENKDEIIKINIDKEYEDKKESIEENTVNNVAKYTEMGIVDNLSSNASKCSFCTIVSKDYLIKILAFYYSLERHSKNFHLWICCIDEDIFSSLSTINLKNASLIHLSTLEDQQLLAIKNTRKINEYCWTLKAAVVRYILMHFSIDSIIYCDSDMFFFSDPQMVFDEWGEASIFLCPQRDLEWVHNMYGKYQAGFIGFKKDTQGLNCVNWWNKKCIEWCYGQPDPQTGRWGDQKYLDQIPRMFSSVKISNNLGVDAAPWNTIYNNNFNISSQNNEIYIEGDKLIAYHFACLSIFNEDDYDLWTFNYLSLSSAIKSYIYIPYIESLRNAINIIKTYLNENKEGLFNRSDPKEAQTLFKYSPLTLTMAIYNDYYSFCTITSREYLLQCMALYSSLKDKINNFNLFVCCMDEISFYILSNLKLENMTIIKVDEVEDTQLISIKQGRSMQEYCWTIKAPLILFILEKYGIDSVVYCDADIFFFYDPNTIFDQWENYDTLICPQRDYPEFEKVHGRFQAGFLGFRNRASSLAILEWWKNKCIDWCFDKPDIEMERWGDQKYLDQIPNLFYSIKILDDLGIDAAPWNLIINNNYKVSNENNTIQIDGFKLIVYHFGSMYIFDESTFDLWKLDPLFFSKEIIDSIYTPYIIALQRSMEILKSSGLVDLKVLFSTEPVINAKNPFKL